jgi:hypothetical protein
MIGRRTGAQSMVLSASLGDKELIIGVRVSSLFHTAALSSVAHRYAADTPAVQQWHGQIDDKKSLEEIFIRAAVNARGLLSLSSALYFTVFRPAQRPHPGTSERGRDRQRRRQEAQTATRRQ